MIGLLIKDMYIMFKQAKILLALVVILALISHDFMYVYALFYAAMLPITALSYDERAKWDKFVTMMPYTVSEIIGSKYIMGYLCIGAVVLLTCLGKIAAGVAGGKMPTSADWTQLVFTICLTLALQAVNLPFMFWVGTEKGRLIFVLLVVCSVIGAMQLLEGTSFSGAHAVSLSAVLLGGAAFSIFIHIVSFQISKMLYKWSQ